MQFFRAWLAAFQNGLALTSYRLGLNGVPFGLYALRNWAGWALIPSVLLYLYSALDVFLPQTGRSPVSPVAVGFWLPVFFLIRFFYKRLDRALLVRLEHPDASGWYCFKAAPMRKTEVFPQEGIPKGMSRLWSALSSESPAPLGPWLASLDGMNQRRAQRLRRIRALQVIATLQIWQLLQTLGEPSALRLTLAALGATLTGAVVQTVAMARIDWLQRRIVYSLTRSESHSAQKLHEDFLASQRPLQWPSGARLCEPWRVELEFLLAILPIFCLLSLFGSFLNITMVWMGWMGLAVFSLHLEASNQFHSLSVIRGAAPSSIPSVLSLTAGLGLWVHLFFFSGFLLVRPWALLLYSRPPEALYLAINQLHIFLLVLCMVAGTALLIKKFALKLRIHKLFAVQAASGFVGISLLVHGLGLFWLSPAGLWLEAVAAVLFLRVSPKGGY